MLISSPYGQYRPMKFGAGPSQEAIKKVSRKPSRLTGLLTRKTDQSELSTKSSKSSSSGLRSIRSIFNITSKQKEQAARLRAAETKQQIIDQMERQDYSVPEVVTNTKQNMQKLANRSQSPDPRAFYNSMANTINRGMTRDGANASRVRLIDENGMFERTAREKKLDTLGEMSLRDLHSGKPDPALIRYAKTQVPPASEARTLSRRNSYNEFANLLNSRFSEMGLSDEKFPVFDENGNLQSPPSSGRQSPSSSNISLTSTGMREAVAAGKQPLQEGQGNSPVRPSFDTSSTIDSKAMREAVAIAQRGLQAEVSDDASASSRSARTPSPNTLQQQIAKGYEAMGSTFAIARRGQPFSTTVSDDASASSRSVRTPSPNRLQRQIAEGYDKNLAPFQERRPEGRR